MIRVLVSGSSIQVQALAGDIILCSWARDIYYSYSVSLHPSIWVLENLMLGGGGGGNPTLDWHPMLGGVEILKPLHATETGISSGLMGHLT